MKQPSEHRLMAQLILRTDTAERLVEQIVKLAVRTERQHIAGIVLEAAEERADSGDPEGAGVLRDLAREIKRRGK